MMKLGFTFPVEFDVRLWSPSSLPFPVPLWKDGSRGEHILLPFHVHSRKRLMHLKMETGMTAIKPDTLGSAKVGQRKSGQVKVADGVGLAKCDIYQLHRRQSAYGSDDIVRFFFFLS